MRRFFFAVLLSCITATVTTPCFSDVFVADQMRFEALRGPFQVNAGGHAYYDLGTAISGDRFDVKIQSTNGFFPDISAYVCLKGGTAQNCFGYTKVKAPYSFAVDVTTSGAYQLWLDNSYSAFTTKKGVLTVNATLQIDQNTKAQFAKMFSDLQSEIFATFKVQQFDMNLEPCGTENAFSRHDGGHITICSELFVKLIREQKTGALIGIIFHELGHSLLNLWGQPNWQNEETVDEFAITMMYWDGIQEKAFDWVSHFEAQNSAQEASYILEHGDTHPLSIQRARNARRILTNPAEVINRWNKFLYPHLTTRKLQALLDNPGKYGDRVLAKQILAARP